MSKVSDIFKTTGQPDVTYVSRKEGQYENKLKDFLEERGQLCLVTGPSKTGKTTLLKKVLDDQNLVPLVVRCTSKMDSESVWRRALEEVDFSRAASISGTSTKSLTGTAEMSGGFGWKLLAQLTGRLSVEAASSKSDHEVRELILSDPSPHLLIPILKNSNYIFVLEDFHYLPDSEKRNLFEYWKQFVDEEVSTIILGTSHHSIDIAKSNSDLVGRISYINIESWNESDLMQIIEKGMKYLSSDMELKNRKTICSEAVGLPIIVQQICLQLFRNISIYSVLDARKKKHKFNESEIKISLYNVSQNKYSHFQSNYDMLKRGPREKARKYRTYELIIACYTIDPVEFSLTRKEIDLRMGLLDLADNERPPPASINSTLGALRKFQEKRGFVLLEWMGSEDRLYITEPSFLFFIRCNARRHGASERQLDLFESLLSEESMKILERKLRELIEGVIPEEQKN